MNRSKTDMDPLDRFTVPEVIYMAWALNREPSDLLEELLRAKDERQAGVVPALEPKPDEGPCVAL